MAVVALALHIFGSVVWVGGMLAIYVCLRPALDVLEPLQRLRLMLRPSSGEGTKPVGSAKSLGADML